MEKVAEALVEDFADDGLDWLEVGGCCQTRVIFILHADHVVSSLFAQSALFPLRHVESQIAQHFVFRRQRLSTGDESQTEFHLQIAHLIWADEVRNANQSHRWTIDAQAVLEERSDEIVLALDSAID